VNSEAPLYRKRSFVGVGNMRKFGLICVIVACSALVRPALAQQAGGFAIEAPGIDNFAGLAIGAVPDYSGSDDYTFGIAPLLPASAWKKRTVFKGDRDRSVGEPGRQ
jgi:hypothetical protein